MPNWRPENEIDREIAAAWNLTDTETAVLGALVVTPGGKLRQAARGVPAAEPTARNAMCHLRRRLREAGVIGPDCNDTDALVRTYLLAESRTGSAK